MKNKQTAVEWLEDNLIGNPFTESDFVHNRKMFNLAKAMEKQQIMDAYMDSYGNTTEPEDYYNETYGKENK